MTKIISISLTEEDAKYLNETLLKPSHVFRQALIQLRQAGSMDVFRENEDLKRKIQKLASLIQEKQEEINVLEQKAR